MITMETEKKMVKINIFDVAVTANKLGSFIVKNAIKIQEESGFLIIKCREDNGDIKATYIAQSDIISYATPEDIDFKEGESRFTYDIVVDIYDAINDKISSCSIKEVLQDSIKDDKYIVKSKVEITPEGKLLCNNHHIDKSRILRIEKSNFKSFSYTSTLNTKESNENAESTTD